MGGELGFEQALKFNNAGVLYCRDVEIARTKNEIETTTRQSGGFVTRRGGLRTTGITFTLRIQDNRVGEDTAGYGALKTAYVAGSSIPVTTEDASGDVGINGDFDVIDMSESQPLDGEVTVSVSLVASDKPNNTDEMQ